MLAEYFVQQRMLIHCKHFSVAFFKRVKRPRISTDLTLKRSKERRQNKKCELYILYEIKIINLLLSSMHHLIIRILSYLVPPSISIFLLFWVPHVKKRSKVVPSEEMTLHWELRCFIRLAHDPVHELFLRSVYFYKITSKSIYNCCHLKSRDVNKISKFESIKYKFWILNIL